MPVHFQCAQERQLSPTSIQVGYLVMQICCYLGSQIPLKFLTFFPVGISFKSMWCVKWQNFFFNLCIVMWGNLGHRRCFVSSVLINLEGDLCTQMGHWAGSSPVSELKSPDSRQSNLKHPASPPVFTALTSFTCRAFEFVVSSIFICFLSSLWKGRAVMIQ